MIHNTPTHPKFRKLQKRLSLPLFQVVGVLESLWHLTVQCADNGDLSRFSPEDICDFMGWLGNPDELIDALVECRWLDRVDGGLFVHDWLDHAPTYVKDRHRKRESRAKDRHADSPAGFGVPDYPASPEPVQDSPGQSATISPSPGMSHPTQPNRTGPNQSQPSQTNSIIDRSIDWKDRWSKVPNEFFERVRESAVSLSRASKSIDRDFIWQACWVGTELGRDQLLEAIERIRTKDARKPQPYLGKVLVTICENHGHDWDRLRALVPPTPASSPQQVRIVEESVA